jgi:tellurite methyltransferase
MNEIENVYWNDFYKKFNDKTPSAFSIFILEYLKKHNDNFKILDVGCGTGKDSYLLSSEHSVTGIDISNQPINNQNCNFVCGDMIKFDKSPYNLIYSRFTLHSITDKQQDDLIKSISQDTLLCIETRSNKGENSFRVHGDNHYRNLTCIDKLKNLLNKYNFKILFITESTGVAIYKNEDPICIRVICKN